MDVLQIGDGQFHSRPSGLNRMVHHLGQALPASGVNTRSLMVGDSTSPSGQGEILFAHASELLPVRLWKSRRAVAGEITARRPDLVAAHFAPYTWAAMRHLRRVPLVVHFHGPWSSESCEEGQNGVSVYVKRALERATYRRAGRVIVLSDAYKELATRMFRLPEELMRVVPGGVATDAYRRLPDMTAARDATGVPHDRPAVLTVRRLVHRMGLDNLLEAWAKVVQRLPDALLLVAGRGHLESTLREQAVALGVDPSVRFLGFVPDDVLPLHYRAADLTVVPSVALEGFGLTAVESLAAGTPALVTPVGGLPEAMRGLDGEVVLPGTDAGSIAEGLLAALEGRLQLPTDAACQTFAWERYDWPVIANRIRHVYEELVN